MGDFQILDYITEGVMALDRDWKFRNIIIWMAASSVIAARQGRGERKVTQGRDAASTRASKLSAGTRTPRKYPEPSSRS